MDSMKEKLMPAAEVALFVGHGIHALRAAVSKNMEEIYPVFAKHLWG
jgi:hypothetical protein